jgi:hypothetical protein
MGDGVLGEDSWFVFFFFVFFFPRPAAAGGKNGASKGDGTEIQMKNGIL